MSVATAVPAGGCARKINKTQAWVWGDVVNTCVTGARAASFLLAFIALLCNCFVQGSMASTQTLAAGKAQTNLPTETTWPGAQDPPYICCWGSQGQYVTFSFAVAATGPTTLALRYSAGDGAITRKIELDGATWVAKQTFPGTASWSTWATLTLSETLSAGAHTLTILFDVPSGSAGYLNLDNLTISQASGTTSQTLAAGKAQTNLATESSWPGAQDPPYICCWDSQGQYVTFSFTVAGGPTTLALRYSAGDGAITRKIELDGATLVADQAFPGTPNWSTWATLTLTQTLSSGAHTFTIVFDTPSGSKGFLNLDNLTVVAGVSGGSQTLAAGKAQTNLATESLWPGAQDPPYICCWDSQGQYVTFSFVVPGGSTSLVLRYSAGGGAITRKIEIDGAVVVANESFPRTPNWSTWTTLSLSHTFAAGTHTLTVIFDSVSGSAGYLNLDNLLVSYGGNTTPPPVGATVALGYADSATGLTPWSGSANTLFIGEGPQCCATHGPDNGSPGYDGGAIEVTNSGTAPLTVNDVSVDFGGGSSPSSFALWNGTASNLLPQTLAAGEHLVLTMTSGFNFDTSDLFGEACHINSGVVPVVHATLNGIVTDYMDDHQILNSDGADLASCPGDVSEQVAFSTVVPGTQPPAVPVNDVAPALTGVATEGHILSGFAGAWNASPPPSLALQWLRCNSSAASCAAISGATTATYIPTVMDVGSTIRLQVTASNASGKLVRDSAATGVVAAGAAVSQMGDISTGFTSVYVQTVTELSSIFTASSSGKTTDFEFFARGAGGTQVFTPKIYSVVSGKKGSLLGTGAAVTVPMGTNGRWYVSALSGVQLVSGTQYVLALDPSGSKSTYVGAEPSGEMAFFVDYAP